MPGTERKDSPEGLIEYGRGVFVTAAMMSEINKTFCLPGVPERSESSERDVTLTGVIERLDRIERMIKYIFDGHVLIDGRFRKVTP